MAEISFDLLGWRTGKPAIALIVGKGASLGRMIIDTKGVLWLRGSTDEKRRCAWRDMDSRMKRAAHSGATKKPPLFSDTEIPATLRTITVEVLKQSGRSPAVEIKAIHRGHRLDKETIGTLVITRKELKWLPWKGKIGIVCHWTSFKNEMES